MTSEQYWAIQVRLLRARHPEAVRVELVKRMPPPSRRERGVYYVRPASAGRWGKSRMERYEPLVEQ